MTDQNKRREEFESVVPESSFYPFDLARNVFDNEKYNSPYVQARWEGYNAALDSAGGGVPEGFVLVELGFVPIEVAKAGEAAIKIAMNADCSPHVMALAAYTDMILAASKYTTPPAPAPHAQPPAPGGVEPVEYQYRTKPTWNDRARWCDWRRCNKESFDDYTRTSLLHDWAYETRKLYTADAIRVAEQRVYAECAEMVGRNMYDHHTLYDMLMIKAKAEKVQ